MALAAGRGSSLLLKVSFLSSPVRLTVPLQVAAGECVAVTGASGSGKSLFLRALADLDPNDAVIELDGVQRSSFAAPDWRRQVTYVPAESGWWAERVRDHFCPEDLAALVPMLRAIGLDATVLDWDVMRLSTGERQRLALARAFVQQPAVLLLDEPTAALDGEATRWVETLLRVHLERGGILLLVTHDPEQATRLAQRSLHVAALTVTEGRA